MNNLLNKLSNLGVTVVSNIRTSNEDGPTIHTTPSPGSFQISAAGGAMLKVSEKDHVALAVLDQEFCGAVADSFKPTVNVPNFGDQLFLVYKGGKTENGKTGSKLQKVGATFQFSAMHPWSSLGGNEKTKLVYTMAGPFFGFAIIGDEVVPVTPETDNATDVDGVIAIVDNLTTGNPTGVVGTVAEAKDLTPFFVLQYEKEVDKLERESSTEEKPKAAKTGKAAAAASTAAPLDLGGFGG